MDAQDGFGRPADMDFRLESSRWRSGLPRPKTLGGGALARCDTGRDRRPRRSRPAEGGMNTLLDADDPPRASRSGVP